ncbi:MAG: hypothetical protein EXQ86_04795 [Rhodospirillales bacterium]|nr:hypothetical protein [Rhodospirillales bacterium]
MDVGTIASGIMALQQAGGESGSNLMAVKQKAAMEQAIAQMVAEATQSVQSSKSTVDVLA